jgi:hypothetical protein
MQTQHVYWQWERIQVAVGEYRYKYPMRLYEITQPDPILSDAKTVSLIQHYLGNNVVKQIQDASPYNPSSPYKNYKGIYDRIAKRVVPMAQAPTPDVRAIISAVNKELPIVNLPAQLINPALWTYDAEVNKDKDYSNAGVNIGAQTWKMPAD